MKKRLGSFLLTLAMVVSLIPAGVVPVRAADTWDGTIAAGFAGGSGTEADPYQIATGTQLAYFALQVNSGTTYSGNYFLLTADIDLNNQPWTPIGNFSQSSRRLYGSFDGGGHTVSNLYIDNSNTNYQGLFGYCENGTLKNLSVSGSVTGKNYTGGIVGHSQAGKIKFCSSSVTVVGASYVGGIVGKQSSGYIEYCSNTGSVSGSNTIGGIAGEQHGVSIKQCWNTGPITGTSRDVGGIVGNNYASAVENCYNTGSITGASYGVGGVVGDFNHSASSAKNCYNTGTVTLNTPSPGKNPGGIVGDGCNADENHVTACFFLETAATYDVGDVPTNTNAASKSDTELKAKSTFTGWDFTGIWEIIEGSGYPTLRPIYTVTFDSDGGSAVVSVTVAGGNAVAQPATPTKDGYVFVRWQKDGADYDFATPVTANMTLTAQWTVTTYPVWIGGTQVTSVNASDVLGDGKVSYDAESSTLTLNGATITNGYAFTTGNYALIGAKGMDLTVRVTGDSTLQSTFISDTTNGGISLVGSGNTLTITVDEGKTLTTVGPDANARPESESSGIYTNGALVINGAGAIDATGGDSGQSSYGIHVKNGITISNGIITATADTRPTSGSYGISAGSNPLTISGGDITASGKDKAILHNTTVNSTLGGVGYTALDAAEGTNFEAGNGLELHDYKKVRFFPVVSVTGVTLNKSSTSLTVGSTETLAATVAPANATNKTVTWTSSDESIATVENGVVTAVAEGMATITAASVLDSSKTATCNVSVATPPPATVNVTFNANGGTGTMAPQAVAKDTATALNANTFTRSGYAFSGWNTAANGSGTAYTDKAGITLFSDTTLFAQWTKKGGAGPAPSPTPAPAPSYDPTPYIPAASTVPAEPAEPAATPSDGSSGTVETPSDDTSTKAVAEISPEAVEASVQTGEPVTLSIEASAAPDTEHAAAIRLTLPEAGLPVKIEIPVKDVTPGTVAVLVKPDGTEEIIKASTADESGVTLTLDGSATVKIVDNTKTFPDVPPAEWYADAVAWASSREIMNGTGEGFEPSADASRGMIAQLLYNFDSADDRGEDVFLDVFAGDWYYDAVAWASDLGVIEGFDDGTFRPEQNTTREQFAVMLYRYAASKGYILVAEATLDGFADADSVSDWAETATRWAVGAGIISGTESENGSVLLDPQGNATRAQIAAMMQRFCKNVIG